MKKAISLLCTLLVAASLSMTASAADFTDVDSGAWYADAVDYVVSNKLMGGYNETTFGTNDTLSRAMVVQILYNKEGTPVTSGKHSFTDVASGQWYNNAVAWGTAKGVMSGYSGGKFGPDDNVTLEQLAVILWNYSGNPSFTAKADSVGVHSAWADNGLAWAVENSILANVPYESVTAGATRAQTAQILTNYLTGPAAKNVGVAVTAVSLDTTTHKMGEGHTLTLKPAISPDNATNTTITWSSADPKIATVDQNGKVTGVSGGVTIITAKSINGKTATCTVDIWHSHKLTETKTVGTDGASEIYTCTCGHSYDKWIPAVRVKSIGLGTASASVDVGKTATLKATITPSDATFKNVTWSSSDTKIATVSNGVITGVSPGTAKIYATADGVKAYCEITVKEAPIVYQGSGDKIISGINLPEGIYVAEILTDTTSFTHIYFHYSDNRSMIASEYGEPYTGTVLLKGNTSPVADGMLEIECDGPWKISIRKLSGVCTNNISGSRDAVTGFIASSGKKEVIRIDINADNCLFDITLFYVDSSGTKIISRDMLVNGYREHYVGEILGDMRKDGLYFFEVDAGNDADWSISFGNDPVTKYNPTPVSNLNSSESAPGTSEITYYKGFEGVPDFGAFVGVKPAWDTVYKSSEVYAAAGSNALSRYIALLEQNGFVALGGHSGSDVSFIIYKNDALGIQVYISTVYLESSGEYINIDPSRI